MLRADVLRIGRAGDARRRSRRAAGRRGSSTSTACAPGRGSRSRRRARACARIVLVEDVRPVGSGRLALQPGLVREHPPDREALDRPERALRRLELGKKRNGGIVERELPLVAKLHDRRRRERLRDRGDPVERLRIGRAHARRRSANPTPPAHASSPSWTTPTAAPGSRFSFTKDAAVASYFAASSAAGLDTGQNLFELRH